MTNGPIVDVLQQPDLDRPVMVVALDGWIDAGMGAANTTAAVMAATEPDPVAVFDVDRLLDHRARRPTMHLVNGLITGLTWPGIELRAGVDLAGNDLLLLMGAEPDSQWHAFTDAVLALADSFECRMLVFLGAYPAPVAHTRPAALSITTSSPDMSSNLRGYVRGTLDVPAGIHTVLDVAANDSGIDAVGLWAQVPHYVAAMPYPAASLALLEGLRDVAGLDISSGQLDTDAKATRIRLDELVAENSQHQSMVAQLEAMMDEGLGGPSEPGPQFGFTDLPSGEELADELQRFLRDHPEDPDPD